MSACSILDRITMINTPPPNDLAGGLIVKHQNTRIPHTGAPPSENHQQHHHHSQQHHNSHHSSHHQQQQQSLNNQTLPHTSIMNGTTSVDRGGGTVFPNNSGAPVPNGAQEVNGELISASCMLERDYYGCYCLKFIVKNGTHITEDKVLEDFGAYGDVVDVRGPGLFSGLRGNHVYVRFIDRADAEEALRNLSSKYHQLTPASISDVLPDNYGLYTISFYNKTGIPSAEVRREFSKFGEVKNLTGSLDVKGGRVFVSYKEKGSAVAALQAFFFRKDRYPNMKFALPRCEKDYFGCYCLKFYNKSGDVTEEKVLRDFGQFGDVVDVRGPGLFDVTGDDVYVRYKEKSSAEQALIELVGRYDSLCLAPPSDIQADKFGYFTITFVNDKCLSKSDVWYIFSKFGTVACVNGTFDCKKGRVFVSYKEKQGALNALETMLITKEYHLQVSKNSTVRKNDYNVAVPPPGIVAGKDPINEDFDSPSNGGLSSNSSASNLRQLHGPPAPPNGVIVSPANHSPEDFMHKRVQRRDQSRSREPSLVPGPHPLQSGPPNIPPPIGGVPSGGSQNLPPMPGTNLPPPNINKSAGGSHENSPPPPQRHQQQHPAANVPPLAVIPPVTQGIASQQPNMQQIGINSPSVSNANTSPSTTSNEKPNIMMVPDNASNSIRNGLVKFNRNVEKDIFGYFCLSFLNEDGDINEKKVRHDFGKFGEVVSVRGALGKQKGHVFVRFRRKEAAENCLNCLNSFPLSEMSELFGKYLFLSPATPRDIDCDMWGLYSISFLNLNMKNFKEIRSEFSKFGEIVRLQSGGGGNTDELVSISYADKNAAVKALQTHFTNKEFPYLDIAKGSSLLLVNSSDSSDNEEVDGNSIHHQYPSREMNLDMNVVGNGSGNSSPSNTRQVLGSNPTQKSSITSVGPPLNAAPGAPIRHHNQHNTEGSGKFNGHIGPGYVRHNGRNGNGNALPSDDLFLGRNGGQNCGSDVVDELLKPLQSYFSIYRTGQYHSPTGEGLLGQLGVTPGSAAAIAAAAQAVALQNSNENSNPEHYVSGPPTEHNQTTNTPNNSPDKKYRIKNVKIPNGVNMHVPPPNMVQGNPPLHTASNTPVNRTPNRHQPVNFQSQHSPMSHQPHQQQSSPRQMIKLHQNNSKNNSNGHFVNGHHRSSSSGASCVNVVPVSKMNDVINSTNISTNNIKDELESTNGSNTLSSTFLAPEESNPTSTHPGNIGNTNLNDYSKGPLLLNGFIDHENQATTMDPLRKESQFSENVPQQLLATVAVNHDSGNNPNISHNKHADLSPTKRSGDIDKEFGGEVESKYNANNVEIEGEASQRSDSPIQIEQDVFGFYSLCMVNKSKDLTERKVKIDFSRQADNCTTEGIQPDINSSVARVRGQFVPGETITISFFARDMAVSCLANPALLAKYPTLRAAPLEEVVCDKDGHYSIEFVNSGMSGIREITNEFSRHGEVVKVMAGGAKNNAVKRVTISYSDKESAFAAVNAAHGKNRNKDFQSVDFAKECLVQISRKASLPNVSNSSNKNHNSVDNNIET